MTQPSAAASTPLRALALAVAANLPAVLWGPPGTGKSAAVRALGSELGVPVEVVIGSLREPSDFAGLPILADGGTAFAPPRWAQRLATAGGGLLFLDELTTAPPSVQAAMLRVILERWVGDLRLPDAVRVIAAANPPALAADGWDLSAPLANRLVHLDWPADPIAVADGFERGFPGLGAKPYAAPEPLDVEAAIVAIGRFLRVRPELVLDIPEGPELAGRAWPSPRTWEMAARAVAVSRINGASEEVRIALVSGCVGEPAAWEALSWLDAVDLPDPRRVLADPSTALPERLDRLHTLLHAVVATAVADGSADAWRRAWQVLAHAARTAPDVAATAARTLSTRRPAGASLPPELDAFIPLLREAGLL